MVPNAAGALTPRQTTSPPVSGGSSAEQQLLTLISNPFQSSFQENSFGAALGTSVGVFVLLCLLFSFVRPRHTLVYAPKTKHADEKHAPPPMGKGFWSWIGPTWKASETMLVEKIGLDAVIFLRFTRMLRNLFIALGLVGLLVMIPVNVADRNKSISTGLSAFAIMTPLYVFGNGIWAQVVCAWIFDIIACYFLWRNYRAVHRLRRDYFQSPEYQRSLHARTLIVRDIPSKMRTDEGILQLTDEVNPLGILPRTTIGRNVRLLPDLIEEHEENVKKLESILSKYLQNPDKLPPNRPTMHVPKKYKGPQTNGRVDAIEYLTTRIRELEEEIKSIRQRVDKRDAMPYGFASWEQIDQAHVVAYAARKKKLHGATIRLAPRPNDLIWDNLALSRGARRTKKIMNMVWISILTLLWMPVNAGIAIFLSNLANLGSVWKGFQGTLDRNKTWWTLVQGIAAPALLSLVYLILPSIFRRLQMRAGDLTKTSREHHVLRNLFVFFTLNNLIVFSIFSAIWQFVTIVVKSDQPNVWDAIKSGNFFLTLTTALCQISPFWVNWLLQRHLGAAVDIAQLWPLTYVWFCRTFRSPTPRENIEWTAPPAFDYASYYNYFLFYSTVALCFSTLQPIVLIITAVYFSVDSILKKYLLMYVFITKTESGGMFWRTLFNRLLFGLILSNVTIGVSVKARGGWMKVYALVPLLFLVLGFKYYCSKTFDDDIHYYARSGMRDQERLATPGKPKTIANISSKFGHPAMYKPLMTPMVHAKARQVLGQIYSGRLNSVDGAFDMGFSDVALGPMNQNGKPAQDSPFELVPETQQDFSYYKNRSDFREEGGEIYGKPEDLTSERSKTPLSWMGPDKDKDLWSPASSRPGTPTLDGSPSTPRKEALASVHRKPVQVYPAYRSGTTTREASLERQKNEAADLGLGHTHVESYDDTTNLLGGVADLPTSTPRGEFMHGINPDRFQTQMPGGSGGYRGIGRGERVEEEVDTSSYDYFRGTGRER
jgi:hypothetical protein